MKIIRHTARDMRQAMRAVREQLGDDAVILASRRTAEGVEVTAAVDFDAATLEADGFAAAVNSVNRVTTTVPSSPPQPAALAAPAAPQALAGPTLPSPAPQSAAALATREAERTTANDADWISAAARDAVLAYAQEVAAAANVPSQAAVSVANLHVITEAQTRGTGFSTPARAVASSARAPRAAAMAAERTAPMAAERTTPMAAERTADTAAGPVASPVIHGEPDQEALEDYHEAMASAIGAPTLSAASTAVPGRTSPQVSPTRIDVNFDTLDELPEQSIPMDVPTVTPSPAVSEQFNSELKTLRQLLETQLANLAWNDMARRAPVRVEMLRELAEIGITHDLSEHLVRQVPEDQDLTFARRFAIAGLSQYLRTTGDHWLNEGGRVAFIGATGVGKTTTIAKLAVRWVLRHGPRNVALVAADCVRIGAQEQVRALAQMLGVPVYTPESFEALPTLLEGLSERLVLIDTPGASSRDPQLASRLALLQSLSGLQSALVLAASTQTGAIEECLRHFNAAQPACCVLTKLDEAASLGGLLSALIQARLPIAYTSEGQRVPEDLRPARALELVSAAVRLAKDNGAAADEDLLQRRFGKTAHGFN